MEQQQLFDLPPEPMGDPIPKLGSVDHLTEDEDGNVLPSRARAKPALSAAAQFAAFQSSLAGKDVAAVAHAATLKLERLRDHGRTTVLVALQLAVALETLKKLNPDNYGDAVAQMNIGSDRSTRNYTRILKAYREFPEKRDSILECASLQQALDLAKTLLPTRNPSTRSPKQPAESAYDLLLQRCPPGSVLHAALMQALAATAKVTNTRDGSGKAISTEDFLNALASAPQDALTEAATTMAKQAPVPISALELTVPATPARRPNRRLLGAGTISFFTADGTPVVTREAVQALHDLAEEVASLDMLGVGQALPTHARFDLLFGGGPGDRGDGMPIVRLGAPFAVLRCDAPADVADRLQLDEESLTRHGLHLHAYKGRTTVFGPVDSATIAVLRSDGLHPVVLLDPQADLDFAGMYRGKWGDGGRGAIVRAMARKDWRIAAAGPDHDEWTKRLSQQSRT